MPKHCQKVETEKHIKHIQIKYGIFWMPMFYFSNWIFFTVNTAFFYNDKFYFECQSLMAVFWLPKTGLLFQCIWGMDYVVVGFSVMYFQYVFKIFKGTCLWRVYVCLYVCINVCIYKKEHWVSGWLRIFWDNTGYLEMEKALDSRPWYLLTEVKSMCTSIHVLCLWLF